MTNTPMRTTTPPPTPAMNMQHDERNVIIANVERCGRAVRATGAAFSLCDRPARRRAVPQSDEHGTNSSERTSVKHEASAAMIRRALEGNDDEHRPQASDRARRACLRRCRRLGAALPHRSRLQARPDRGERPAGRPAAARRDPGRISRRICSGTCAPASTSPRCNASSRPICARSTIITASSPTIRRSWPTPTRRSTTISNACTARGEGQKPFDDLFDR